jgi:glutamate synthase domain-containing protein 3
MSQDDSKSDRQATAKMKKSSAMDLLARTDHGRTEHVFAIDDLDAAELRQAIYSVPLSDSEDDLTSILVKSTTERSSSSVHDDNAACDKAMRDNVLMRINRPVDIRVGGSLGNYAFALSSEAVIQCFGHVGHGVAEGLASGTVKVRGNAGDGAGAAMTGGTLAIYGSAGDRCGGAMRGGGVFVRGNVGDYCGIGALGGIIVVGGDAGEGLGDTMSNATIFIRGRAKSLAAGVTEAPLSKKEGLRLGLLLIGASIRGDAKDFRRLVPKATLESEVARRGEINPSWR